ncbi:hypothetical protein C8J57DRAFT_1728966 [Mycena rebaudengoi]|nr:hypothetical protein C8J57DRAFT_1728966 [Mycena rebaudengoi]
MFLHCAHGVSALEEAYMSDPCLQTGFNLQARKNDVITSTKQTPAPLAPLRSSLTQTTTIPSTLLPYTLIVAVLPELQVLLLNNSSAVLYTTQAPFPNPFPSVKRALCMAKLFPTCIELCPEDADRFRRMNAGVAKFNDAMVEFRKRGKKGVAVEDEE